ncbi:hypothetical protein NQ318_011955 [Aromia moschata]|uniref:Helix-turn-helix domain-containing protein n=1 Tax=Aromia moschata TaxID=1265417 RepID=A0AAV8XPM7_9CUCU|nr:hypothetical protein NQ318_011955 [Aromia moschata]
MKMILTDRQARGVALERHRSHAFVNIFSQRSYANKQLVHGVYTDCYLNATSYHHPQQKRSIIQTLVHRAEIICDDESSSKELNNMEALILTRHAASTRRQERQRYQPTIYACLPYVAEITDRLRKTLYKK